MKVMSALVLYLLLITYSHAEPVTGPITNISFQSDAPADCAKLLFPGGRPKAITMSFDDATLNDRRLIRILNAFGVRGTFHVPFYMLPADGFMPTNEMRTVYTGHEVTVHLGGTHMPTNEYRAMVMDWRQKMEGIVGYQGRGMAYEGGEATAGAILTLPSAGIAYSRCVGSDGSFSLKTNYYTWTTTTHEGGAGDFVDRFLTTQEQPAWFSIWGHSWEFEQSKTWGYWENVCRKLGGHTNVWYATCVEMADYLRAAAALKLLPDGKGVVNARNIPVWLDVHGKTLCVSAGFTTGLCVTEKKTTFWTQVGKGPNPVWPPSDAKARATPPTEWTAFNDVAWDSTQSSSNISLYSPVGLQGGPLVDYATGIRLPVTAMLSGEVGYIEGAAPSHVETGQAAEQCFGKALSLDGYARWEKGSVTLTFAGLNPKRQYDVVLYGSRGSTEEKYRERKTTVCVMTGIETGNNSDEKTLTAADVGIMWYYTSLIPSDGTLSFRLTASGGGGYLNAFMIRPAKRDEPKY